MKDEPVTNTMWSRLAAREAEPEATPESPSLWTMVEERTNPAMLRPRRMDDFELAEVGGGPGAKRYMLKNRRTNVYLHLTEPDVFLWNMMDGTRTVKELVIELFVAHKRYAPDHVTRLVGLLKADGFLQVRHTSVFESLTGRLLGRRLAAKLRAVGDVLTKSRVSLRNVDQHFGALYGRVGWLFYTRIGLLVGLALLLADLALFPYYLFRGNNDLLMVQGRYEWGVLALILISAISIVIHEYAHALTGKHFGREINRAGFMLIFGLPAFFVDTTDMYMTRKWPRIAVSWAGPFANAMLAGFALLMLPLAPPGWLHELLWTFGALNTFFFLSNLVPASESDGDYILMDMLELPRLRQRAFAYLGSDLWRKLWRREQFGRLDAILAGYGVLALAGIAYTCVIAVQLWLTSGVVLAQAVLANPLLMLQIAAPLLGLGAVVYVARAGLPRLRRAVNHLRVADNHLERR